VDEGGTSEPLSSTRPSSITGSLTRRVSVFTVVVEPSTCRSPSIVTVLAKETLPVASLIVIAAVPSSALTAPAYTVGAVSEVPTITSSSRPSTIEAPSHETDTTITSLAVPEISAT